MTSKSKIVIRVRRGFVEEVFTPWPPDSIEVEILDEDVRESGSGDELEMHRFRKAMLENEVKDLHLIRAELLNS